MDPDNEDRYRFVLNRGSETLKSCLSDAPAGSGETPYLDAVILLCHAAAIRKEQLFARLNDTVPLAIRNRFEELISARCSGQPVSYIRGVKEFYGRDFEVGPGTLVPRPDTELLVELAVDEVRSRSGSVHLHDCCTGTGCVGITVAAESGCVVTASDVDERALGFARTNATRLGVSIDLWQGDLLEPLVNRIRDGLVVSPNIITANPPYVADNEVQEMVTRGWPEPPLALAGGAEGLDVITRLVSEAASCLAPGGDLLVEHGADQGDAVAARLVAVGFTEVRICQDLAGRDRVCRGRWFRH